MRSGPTTWWLGSLRRWPVDIDGYGQCQPNGCLCTDESRPAHYVLRRCQSGRQRAEHEFCDQSLSCNFRLFLFYLLFIESGINLDTPVELFSYHFQCLQVTVLKENHNSFISTFLKKTYFFFSNQVPLFLHLLLSRELSKFL